METQKRGRGRPHGSQSFVEVTLAELNIRFRADEKIKIGKIFWQGGQSKVHPSKEIAKITSQTIPSVESPKESAVEMTLTLD